MSSIRQIFRLTLLNGKQVKAILDELVLIETLYNVKEIYSTIGPEFMIALDVALATSGSEAIVESFLFCNGRSEADMLSIKSHYGVEQRSIGCYHMSETIQSV